MQTAFALSLLAATSFAAFDTKGDNDGTDLENAQMYPLISNDDVELVLYIYNKSVVTESTDTSTDGTNDGSDGNDGTTDGGDGTDGGAGTGEDVEPELEFHGELHMSVKTITNDRDHNYGFCMEIAEGKWDCLNSFFRLEYDNLNAEDITNRGSAQFYILRDKIVATQDDVMSDACFGSDGQYLEQSSCPIDDLNKGGQDNWNLNATLSGRDCVRLEGTDNASDQLECSLVKTHFDRPFATQDTENDLQLALNMRNSPVNAFGYYKFQNVDGSQKTTVVGETVELIPVSDAFVADFLGEDDEGEDSAAYMSTLSAAVIVGLSALFL